MFHCTKFKLYHNVPDISHVLEVEKVCTKRGNFVRYGSDER
jgi:hypothetical protein